MKVCGMRRLMHEAVVAAPKHSNKGGSPGAEQSAHARVHGAHVHASRCLRLDGAHDLAHILDARGAGLANDLCNERIELRRAQARGQILLENRDLRRLLGNEIVAAAALILCDGLTTLLDELFEDCDDAGIIERSARIYLALLDSRERDAQHTEARLVRGS